MPEIAQPSRALREAQSKTRECAISQEQFEIHLAHTDRTCVPHRRTLELITWENITEGLEHQILVYDIPNWMLEKRITICNRPAPVFNKLTENMSVPLTIPLV